MENKITNKTPNKSNFGISVLILIAFQKKPADQPDTPVKPTSRQAYDNMAL